MNDSTNPPPVLANLATGDLVCARWNGSNGIVVGIEYIGPCFVVTVAWFDGAATEEDVGAITLLDGSSVVINHTPSAPVAPRRAYLAIAAPTPASSTPAPATTAAPAPRKRWSKVQIVAMIKEKEGAVDRGVLCLNKHAALLPEKSRSFVAFWAGWVGSGKTLSGKHLVNARRTCLFNAKVLVDASNGDI